jgi:hypothetical protein
MSVEREPRWTTIRPLRAGIAPIDDVKPGGWGRALILFSAALCVAWLVLLFWVLLHVVIPLI